MPSVSITLSSGNITNPSNAIALDWRSGTPVMVSVTTNTSSGTGDFTIQYTLNDLQLVRGASNATWINMSSGSNLTPSYGAGLHVTSSTISPDGVVATFLASPAAVRINSTALSSNTLTLTVLQADGR